jgi:hypothetical protein
VAKALLTAILCGSYKNEAAALSKLNLVRKILAHVSQAISRMTRPSADRRTGAIDSTEALPLRKWSISTRLRSAPDGENERKQVMVWLPLRLPLATELLTR